MSLTRLFAMVHKEFLQVFRDPRTLTVTLFMPLLQLLLFGYAATADVKNVSLAVWDQDQSDSSRALLAAYRSADYFSIDHLVGSEAEMRRLIDSGSARAGLVIPPGYGNTLASGQTAQIGFVIDGSDPSVAGTALAAAQSIGQAESNKLLVQRATALGQAGGISAPIDVRTQVWYNPDQISAYYMVPALIGLILQFIAASLTASAVVRERERGTIEQLIVTPLSSIELMVAKLMPFVIIGLFDTVEILVLGVLLFHVPINGSLALFMLLSVLFLASSLGIGLFISTVAHTQQEAQMSTQLIALPSMFLSGFLYPLAAMPRVLQLISFAIPLRYFLAIARGIILKGVGVEALWPNVIALAVFSVVIMSAAMLRFHKSLD